MEKHLLTLRVLYRLLADGVEDATVPLSYLNREAHFTQTGFWGSFFTAGVPEPVIGPWFYTEEGRPRALSNVMNRTVVHSLPLRLKRQLEEYLNPETMIHITLWLASVLNHDIHASLLHHTITRMEEQLYAAGTDLEFHALYPFFVSLRPGDADEDGLPAVARLLQAAFRFSMLGVHAAYGDQMLSSRTLAMLRSCNLCDPRGLWQAARALAPGLRKRDFFSSDQRLDAEGDSLAPGMTEQDRQLMTTVHFSARKALMQAASCLPDTGENAGWYVVANWMDTCVNLNDRPAATYAGAEEMGTVPNGELLYVLSAPGYRGLHDSGAVWGSVFFQGKMGYVPMNLLVRLNIDKDKGKEGL